VISPQTCNPVLDTTMRNEAIAERAPDLIFAKTREGLSLPVIDFTNPRFAVPDTPESHARQRDAFLAWYAKQQRLPKFIMRLFLKQAAKRSRLVHALFQADKGFLDSISTYVLKLGVDNLPPGFDTPVDKRVAASPHVALIRLRMYRVAKLLADALAPALSANINAPLHLINIAGGPALDSINALTLLRRAGVVLENRRITIHVLDAQDDGPFFGANALRALMQSTAPLHGVDVDFQHQAYDWNTTEPLSQLVGRLMSQDGIVAASSEGGLFEYGSDAAIVANLQALAADKTGVRFVAGSVTSSSEIRKKMIAETKFKLHPRGTEGFAPLAASAGYDIVRTEPDIMSDQVLLRLRR
jgi:hypothetical protein